jgi:hypothetical protein
MVRGNGSLGALELNARSQRDEKSKGFSKGCTLFGIPVTALTVQVARWIRATVAAKLQLNRHPRLA